MVKKEQATKPRETVDADDPKSDKEEIEESNVIITVFLSPEGGSREVTCSSDGFADLLGGFVTFMGHFPVGNIVGVKLKKQDERKMKNIHTSAFPFPFRNEVLYGPILLLKMDDNAIPCSFRLNEYEKYKMNGWSVINEKKKKKKNVEEEGEEEEDGDEKKEEDGENKAREGKRKRKRKSKDSNLTKEEVEEEGREEGMQSTSLNDKDIAPLSIYIEGISYDANEDDLTSLFKSCGDIVSIRLPRYQDSNKPKGYAHIDFNNINSVEKALKLDGTILMKRFLKIQKAKILKETITSEIKNPNVKKGTCKTLFIKNLPYDINEKDLKESMSKWGEITSVRLAKWNHTDRLKGFGYIEFMNASSADALVNASNPLVKGRKVLIDYEISAPKKSFKDTNGRAFYKEKEKNESGKTLSNKSYKRRKM